MIKVRILSSSLNVFDNIYVQDKVNEALEAIDDIGYIKDIKVNTCINGVNDKIIYTIVYEEA